MRLFTAVFAVITLTISAVEIPSIPPKLMQSTFRCRTTKGYPEGRQAWGSAFAIDLSGYGLKESYLLTAAHVVDGKPDVVEVELAFREQAATMWVPADVVATDDDKDICILRINHDLTPYAVQLATTDEINIGDALICIGCPGATKPAASLGYLSSKNADRYNNQRAGEWIGTCNSYFGNSGGPVFHALTEKAVGILVAGIPGCPNVSLFVPYTIVNEYISKNVEKMRKQEANKDKADTERAKPRQPKDDTHE